VRHASPAPGTLVAFRADTTHEVVPVTYGERYTIVTWFR
jgi:SM-20-related protein